MAKKQGGVVIEDEEFGGATETVTEETTTNPVPSVPVQPEPVYVSKEEFSKGLSDIKDLILGMAKAPTNTVAEVVKDKEEEKKVLEASTDFSESNPRYDAVARDILGEKIDRTFIKYPKGGGTLFTIVIKKEFSNAGKDYLDRMKEDCRTVNIEREEFRGEDGVKAWSKLVKQILLRDK